jgi:hypothetical protein
MIKLIKLLKELYIDELKFRTGELEFGVDDNKTYYTFLKDFKISGDKFFTMTRGKFNSEVFDFTPGVPFDSKTFEKSVISEESPYQLIAISPQASTLYLVNSEGKTVPDYVIGKIEIDKEHLDTRPFGLAGAQINLIQITTPWKKKGLGSKTYNMMLQAYDTLFSDGTLYEGSLYIWIKKLAPLGQQSGNFFGMHIEKVAVSLTIEDATDMSLLKNTNIDSFIVSIKPSQKLLDVKAALAGLSIGKGDYGIYKGEAGLTSSKLQSIVRKGEITSIDGIIEKVGLYQVVGKKDNYSTIVVSLDNTMVILYEENGQITMDLI